MGSRASATDGPSIWVQANRPLNLTLCLHEVATNAVKYGALSNGIGQVRVSWDMAGEADQRRMHLTWQEGTHR
jgi:two-component sensor histidine kinase